METTQALAPGSQVTLTFLPGHALERTITARLRSVYGELVVQPKDYKSDQFLTVVLSDGSINPNLRIDSVE